MTNQREFDLCLKTEVLICVKCEFVRKVFACRSDKLLWKAAVSHELLYVKAVGCLNEVKLMLSAGAENSKAVSRRLRFQGLPRTNNSYCFEHFRGYYGI